MLGSNFATSFDLNRGKDVGQGAMSVLGVFMWLFDISPPKLKYHQPQEVESFSTKQCSIK